MKLAALSWLRPGPGPAGAVAWARTATDPRLAFLRAMHMPYACLPGPEYMFTLHIGLG